LKYLERAKGFEPSTPTLARLGFAVYQPFYKFLEERTLWTRFTFLST
jgi:hypothetical protein